MHPTTSTAAILLAAEAFSRNDDIEAVHAELLRAGVTDLDATKIVLFLPSAFARESYEPGGTAFPDDYFRPTEGGDPRRLPYADEPLYQQSRVVAREFIANGRPTAAILDWSCEAKLVADGIRRGTTLVRVMEVTHHF